MKDLADGQFDGTDYTEVEKGILDTSGFCHVPFQQDVQ